MADSEAFGGAASGIETNFASPEGAAAEGDDATRMLDEMEAMIAVDDADGVGAPAPLDWSDELAPTETDDPS